MNSISITQARRVAILEVIISLTLTAGSIFHLLQIRAAAILTLLLVVFICAANILYRYALTQWEQSKEDDLRALCRQDTFVAKCRYCSLALYIIFAVFLIYPALR